LKNIASSKNLNKSEYEEIYIIGFPSGLPMKMSKGLALINNNKKEYFNCSLDTFKGNSGGPVFNSNDEIIGILVRGKLDFDVIPIEN